LPRLEAGRRARTGDPGRGQGAGGGLAPVAPRDGGAVNSGMQPNRPTVTGHREHWQGDAMDVRDADAGEIGPLAKLWYDGWQDAHAQIVPAELTRARTLESLRKRLQAALPSVRVIGPLGAPVGFHIVKGEELYQLYVSAQARGSGVAAALLADAEARLSGSGVETGWLACAIGNERAAKFYEKCGWRRAGTMVLHLETPKGELPLEVWRYEKSLKRPGSQRDDGT
jgi:GNAT superfamily N-acetyltransferase